MALSVAVGPLPGGGAEAWALRPTYFLQIERRESGERSSQMSSDCDEREGARDFIYGSKVTRRRLVGWGVGTLGATLLIPAPWRAAFGQAKPYKIGTIQPLSGPGALGGKTALVGIEMAVDRINKSGGINGRPIALVVADDESKPDVARRKAEKLVEEDKIDVQ